jgi:hypothetical protein
MERRGALAPLSCVWKRGALGAAQQALPLAEAFLAEASWDGEAEHLICRFAVDEQRAIGSCVIDCGYWRA